MNDQFPHRNRLNPMRRRIAALPPTMRDQVDVDWMQLFRLLRRRFALIAIATVALTLLALPVIMSIPQDYLASTRIILSQPSTANISAQPDEVAVPLDLNTELERLSARRNVEAVIAQLGETRARELVAPKQTRGQPAADPAQQVLDAFYQRLNVRRAGTSEVAEVGFSAPDPRLAADVANMLVQTYVTARNDMQKGRFDVASQWLDARIAQQAARYDEARARAQEFQQTNNLTAAAAGTEPVQAASALMQRSARLGEERASLADTLAVIAQGGDFPTASITGEPSSLTVLRTELQDQVRDVERLQSVYGENYGGAALAREQGDLLRAQIERETEAFRQALQVRVDRIDVEAASIEAQLNEVQGGLSQQSIAGLELAGMLRAAEAEAQALAALERSQRVLAANASLPAVEVEVLSPATPPLGPVGYGRKIYLAMTLLVAGGAALTIAALYELSDRSTRSPAQLRNMAEIVPVGMLPAIGRLHRRKIEDVIRARPRTAYADAMRALMLTVTTANGAVPRSILVTSARRGEGTSTTASALALSLSSSGQGVLLVEIVEDATKKATPLPGIDRMCVEDTALNDQFIGILDKAAKSGNVVIFDAPAALMSSSALQLAGLADETMLVVRWGRTPVKLVEMAVERLCATGADRVLTALNAVDTRRHASYGYRDALVPLRKENA